MSKITIRLFRWLIASASIAEVRRYTVKTCLEPWAFTCDLLTVFLVFHRGGGQLCFLGGSDPLAPEKSSTETKVVGKWELLMQIVKTKLPGVRQWRQVTATRRTKRAAGRAVLTTSTSQVCPLSSFTCPISGLLPLCLTGVPWKKYCRRCCP